MYSPLFNLDFVNEGLLDPLVDQPLALWGPALVQEAREGVGACSRVRSLKTPHTRTDIIGG